jgi:preprotein translocase subunit SecB
MLGAYNAALSTPPDANMTAEQPAATPVFNIEKIYVKDLSVEVPSAPAIFLEREQPQMEMQINTQSAPIENGVYQCILTITVSAKIKEKVAFLVELQHAGIFRIENLPPEAMEPALAIGCPNIIFPYAREAISDAVLKAGFPPLMLQPVNFEMLYMQQQQQAASASGQPN